MVLSDAYAILNQGIFVKKIYIGAELIYEQTIDGVRLRLMDNMNLGEIDTLVFDK